MLDRLNQYKTQKRFQKYELYDMFCEMDNIEIKDIDAFDKSSELDEAYGDIKTTAPTKYTGIRRIFITKYKKFSIDYRKSKQPKNTFTQKFIEDELDKEDCKLISLTSIQMNA